MYSSNVIVIFRYYYNQTINIISHGTEGRRRARGIQGSVLPDPSRMIHEIRANPSSSAWVRGITLLHARHYSQEDMCIIGKEEEDKGSSGKSTTT